MRSAPLQKNTARSLKASTWRSNRKNRERCDLSCRATDGSKKGVLFICLGNICRSPTAEAVFSSVVEKAGLADSFDIDSCGTGGGNPGWYRKGGWSYHEGESADARMAAAASKRGVRLTSKSRPMRPTDFDRFDYLVVMDPKNAEAVKEAAEYWRQQGHPIPDYEDRLYSMASFCSQHDVQTVPDPYYGGKESFESVLDLLDDACQGLLQEVN